MPRIRRKSNVFALRGALPAHGIPDAGTVELLKELLAKAEEGSIAGLAIGWVGPAESLHTRWSGHAGSHDMIALTAQLHHRVMCAWMDD